jgi:hypothetical protein
VDVFVELKAVISDFQAKMAVARGEMEETQKAGGSHFSQLSSLGKGALLGVAGAAVAAGAVLVDLGVKYQAATAKMAAAGDIPIKTANAIGQAFLHTSHDTIYSGAQMVEAFTPVAGQLSMLKGYTASTTSALAFMKVAMDLAEESGSSLGSATEGLTSVMQAYGLNVNQASSVSVTLFNTSRLTGSSIDDLTSTLDRLKARLGVTVPTVGDLSTLLVDLAEHGVTGSRGLMVVNTAMTTLLGSTAKLKDAQTKGSAAYEKTLAADQAAVEKAQAAIASASSASSQKQIANQMAIQQAAAALSLAEARAAADAGKGALTRQAAADSVASAQDRLVLAQDRAKTASTGSGAAQERLAAAQEKLSVLVKDGVAPLTGTALALKDLGLRVYDAKGNFVGMGDVIAQLQPKLEHMTQQQQLSALASVFGASANKALLDTVLAGPAAYEKAAKATSDAAAAHAALVVQQKTLGHELDAMKVAVENAATVIGLKLIPVVTSLVGHIIPLVAWFEKHKAVAEALAVAIGSVLLVAIGAYVVGMASAAVATIAATWPILAIIAAIAAVGAGIFLLVTHWSQAWADIKKWTDDAIAFLRTKFGTLILFVLGPFAPLALLALHWQQVWDGIKQVTGIVVGSVIGFVRNMGDAFFSTIEGILGAASHLPFVGHYFAQANDAVKGFQSDFDGTLSGIANDAGTWGQKTGAALVQGMTAGMQQHQVTALEEAHDISSAAASAMRKGADANSPSRKTMQLGQDMISGLVLGLQNNASHLKQVAQQTVAGAIPGSLGVPGVGGVVGGATLGPFGAAAGAGAAGGDIILQLKDTELARVAWPAIWQVMLQQQRSTSLGIKAS